MKLRKALLKPKTIRARKRLFANSNFRVPKFLKIGTRLVKKVMIQLRLFSLRLFYLPHLFIRRIHDRLYRQSKTYKRYHDHPATEAAHRAALAGFLVSMILFFSVQYILPNVFNLFTPRAAMAGSTSATWNTEGDFRANYSTTGETVTNKNADITSNSGHVMNARPVITGSGVTVTYTDSNGLNPRTSGAYLNGYVVYTITASTTITVSSPITGATVLAVGGGGGGGGGGGAGNGGGGGGQVLTGTQDLSGTINIIVGNGGYQINGYGANGGNTVVSYLTAIGGGGGAKGSYATGGTGASGGGGASGGSGGTGTAGHNGGSSSDGSTGGGGGGAGTAGGNAGGTTAGSGGTGLSSAISGVLKYYGGGGGGDRNGAGTQGAGGNGGGGAGSFAGNGENGTANTGGGGGAAGFYTGGAGGSGVAIIRIPYTQNFAATANLGDTAAGSIGLRANAGSGKLAKWTSITSTGHFLPIANTAIKFRIRVANDTAGDGVQNDLDNASWYGPGGVVSSMSDWTTNYFGMTYGGSWQGSIPSSVPLTQYAELMLQQEASGVQTPDLDDVTLNYDTLEAPVNNNLTIYHTDGATTLKDTTGADLTAGTTGTAGGWSNETAIKFTATGLTCGGGTSGQTGCSVNSTNRKIQVQASLTSDTTFSTRISSVDSLTTTSSSDSGVNYTSTAILTGLSPGSSYHLRVRDIDSEGRQSAWTSYGVNAESAADVSIEQTTPTLANFSIMSTATHSSTILDASGLITIVGGLGKTIISDFGNSSPNETGKLRIQLSNDGTNWGFYDSSSSANVIDNTLANTKSYKSITASASPITDIASAWKVDTGSDGSKTVYIRAIDNALNKSQVGNTATWNSTNDFDGTTQGVATTMAGIIDNSTTPGALQTTPGGSTGVSINYGLGGDTGKSSAGTYALTIPAGVTSFNLEADGAGGGGDDPNGVAGHQGGVTSITSGSNSVTATAGTGGAVAGSGSITGFTGTNSIVAGYGNAGGTGGTTITDYTCGDKGVDPCYATATSGGGGGKVNISITPSQVSGQTLSIVVGAGGLGGDAGTGTAGTAGSIGSLKISYVYNSSPSGTATLGASGTGLRYGNASTQTWGSIHWLANNLSSANKVGIKIRPADSYGSGTYVNPSDNSNSFYYLTAGTVGDIPISASVAKSKTVEIQLELDSDGTGAPVLELISMQTSVTPPSAQIIIDTTPPTGTLSVNSGAQYVKTTAVTLTNNASDSGSGLYQMQFSNDGSSWSGWESYNTTKSWTLLSGDGAKTAYAQYKDNAGNVSTNLTALVTLDSIAPTTTGAITAGTTGTNGWYTSSVTYTLTPADATSGVASTQYCTDTTNSCTPSTTYTTASELSSHLVESASNYVRWASVDNAGNTQTPTQSSVAIKIDLTKPIQATNPFILKAASALSYNLIKRSDTYYVYANAADNAGGSGVSAITANVSGVTTGQTSVALSTTGGPWTVNSNSYAYRSAQLTADSGIADGTKSSTLTTTDNAGNQNTPSGYSVTVDSAAPTIASVTSTNSTGTYYRVGGTINITVNFSEAITSSANITVNLNSGGSCNSSVTNANNGSCTYTVGSSDNANPLNNLSVSGTATDQAGNSLSNFTPASNLTSSKTLVVDNANPTASIAYSIARKVKSGDVQRITATFSEAMVDSPKPKVSISGANTLAATDMTKTDTTHYYYDYTVGAGDGTATVVLGTGTDLAGNVVTAAPTSGATFIVDNTAPTLPTVTIASNNSNNNSLAKSGDVVTLTMVASENISQPTVNFTFVSGSKSGTVTQGADAQHWTATYTMTGTDTEGVIPFSISGYQDTATNPGATVTTKTSGNNVTFDRTGPGAGIGYSYGANHVKQGMIQRITATFSEAMVDSPKPKVSISGANTLAATDMTKTDTTHYYYDYTVGAGDGTATVVLGTGTDLAGNVVTAAPTSGATFIVDNTAPTLPTVTIASNNSNNNSLAKSGDIVTLTMVASENITQPTVNFTFASGSKSGTVTQGSDSQHWTATYTLTGNDTEGTIPFSISGYQDTATNAGATVTAKTSGNNVTFDRTGPGQLSITNVTPNPNNTGNQTVSWGDFTDNAPSSGFGKYVLQRKISTGSYVDVSWGSWGQTQSNHTYADNSNLLSGTYYYHIVSYDSSGNNTAGPDSEAVIIDSQAPAGTVTINNGDAATASTTVNLAFHLTDEFSGVSSYQIQNDGGNWQPSTPVDISSAGLSYNGTSSNWNLFEQGETPVDGIRTVRIMLYDRAGNNTSNITSHIWYDSTAPDDVLTPEVYRDSSMATTLPPNGHTQGWFSYNNPFILFKGSDEQSGVEKFEYCIYKTGDTCDYSALPKVSATLLGGTTYRGGVTLSLADLQQGVLNISVKGVDYSGLESVNATTYVYKFDKIVPTYVNNFSATQGTHSDEVVLTWDKFSTNSTPVAPIEYYKIERVKATYFNGVNDGDWSALNTYQNITCQTAAPYSCLDKDSNPIGFLSLTGSTYTFEDSTTVDGSLSSSVKYIFRVSAKDYANDAYGPVPGNGNQNQFEIFGYTKDTKDPEVLPTSVVAAPCDGTDLLVCNNDLSLRGKIVRLTWVAASDEGSGIDYYEIYRREGGPNDLNGWVKIAQHNAETSGPPATEEYYDPSVQDAKYYSYRIVAVDKARPLPANSTDIVPSGDITNLTNSTPAAIYVFDVTPPVIPDSFSVQAKGIDCFDIDCTPHQQINVSWQKTTDNTPSTTITYRLYISTSPTSGFAEVVSSDTLTPDSNDKFLFEDKGLSDKTTYYYYLTVADGYSNTDSSSKVAATTGNSQAPTPPKDMVVLNNDSSLTDQAHQLRVSFTGSYARAFDEVTKENGIVKYDTYYTATNIQPDTLSNPNDGTANDCRVDETADDCWIRINHAQVANVQDITSPIGDDTHTTRAFTATGLTEATKYFFRARATDNGKNPDNSPAPLKSLLSPISTAVIHNGGWDITRDLTAPILPVDGLDVVVRDTHPNSTVLRNIVSWKILDQPPLRKKQSYETAYNAVNNPKGCKVVTMNGTDYCNDFYSYEVYRQILDSNNSVIYETPSPIKVEQNPETNYYIDEIGSADTIGGMGNNSLLIDAKIRYYVRVVDAAAYSFNYQDGTSIDAAPNKTDKQYSSDTIIPSKSTPSIVGNLVTLSNQGVASYTVSWDTDQDTDALVEFREKYKRNANGNVDTGSLNSDGAYSVIGANTQPGESTSVQHHSVNLFGLKPTTEYDYRVVSHNYLGNNIDLSRVSLPRLVTTGFEIIGSSITKTTTTTGVEITWKTNLDASSSFIEYQLNKEGSDDPQGKTVGVNPEDLAAHPRDHRVSFNGLKSNRAYTFKIKSISTDGYVAETGFDTFRTKSFDTSQFTIAPNSSNLAERNITATSAQIVWQTASVATSWVDYSTTSGNYDNSAGDNVLTMTHVVKLDGLVPGTKYFYRVRSKDNNDIEFTSQEYSFTAILKPKIENMSVTEVKPYSFKISYTTNVDTETLINLGTSAAYGEKRGTPGLTKIHNLSVESLSDNTEYHFQILANDETGNEVAGSDTIVRTPMDTQGPVISNVKVDVLPMGENDTTSSVIISWNTDKPATTLVQYDEGIIGADFAKSSTEDTSLNNSHTVIIKDLQPAASYHYKLVSADKRNNRTESQDFTFVTPSKAQSILQLILKSLEETFAWTSRLNQFFGNIGKRLTGK